MKIVNSKKGYALIFEKNKEDIDCVAYDIRRNMSGQEVADQLNVSRSSISQTLKKSMKKVYYRIRNVYGLSSPIEVLAMMADIFNVNSESEYKKFFNLFPPNIKGEVHAEVFRKYKN